MIAWPLGSEGRSNKMYIPIQVPPPTVGDGIVRWGEGGVINRKETQTNFYNIHLMLPRPGQASIISLSSTTALVILLPPYLKSSLAITMVWSSWGFVRFYIQNLQSPNLSFDIEFPPTNAELKMWPTSFGEQSKLFNFYRNKTQNFAPCTFPIVSDVLKVFMTRLGGNRLAGIQATK